MNIDFLKEVLSLPSISGNESMVRDYIIEFAKERNIDYYVDNKGNLYLTKGTLETMDEYYPCVVSHMDTVHRGHKELIENKVRLVIEEKVLFDGVTNTNTLIAKLPDTDKQTGIGGDDKCGVYVCLELFEKFDKLKGAFFVEEEIGMLGSRQADSNFFGNVGYAIQFDAPSSNWITEICSGVKLFDEDFKGEIKEVLNESGYTKFSIDPFTDVNQLASKFDFNCLNLGCGYYRQHTDHEYVVVEEVSDSVNAGVKLITKLGNVKYTHKKIEKKPLITETKYDYHSYNDSFDYEEYDDYEIVAEELTELIIEHYEKGMSEYEIKEKVVNYLKLLY
jgi:di/tripeptidase